MSKLEELVKEWRFLAKPTVEGGRVGETAIALSLAADALDISIGEEVIPLVEALRRCQTELGYIIEAPTPDLRKTSETENAWQAATIALAPFSTMTTLK